MENMTFYDFVTFVIDFVGVQFLFQNLFHNSWNTEKNMTFIHGPSHYTSQDKHYVVCTNNTKE